MGTQNGRAELLHRELTGAILGAFFEVYRELGHGFVETVYQRALPIALKAKGIESSREVPLVVRFRGEVVGDYRADLVVEGKVIVETKAAERIVPVHELQLINYLKATRLTVGLLLNFGPRPTFRRLVLSVPQEVSADLRGSPRNSAVPL